MEFVVVCLCISIYDICVLIYGHIYIFSVVSGTYADNLTKT